MLKIEDIAFLDLHPGNVRNFQLLCEWIGSAFANAQFVERLQRAEATDPIDAARSPASFADQHRLLASLARRFDFDAASVYFKVELPVERWALEPPEFARMAFRVAERLLEHPELAFDASGTDWDFAFLLPTHSHDQAVVMAQRFGAELQRDLTEAGYSMPLRQRVEGLALGQKA
jgi:hypothetical protein